MKITIQGQDYSKALDAVRPLTIERTLNQPSRCKLWLALPQDGSLAIPVRNQSIEIVGDDGTIYFTGYLAAMPLPEYAGLALEGPRYRIALEVVSDEVLLDQAGLAPGKGIAGESAGALVTSLVRQSGQTSLSVNASQVNAIISDFVPALGASWSENAGQVSDQARASYRAAGGKLTLVGIPGATHLLSEVAGTLDLGNLTLSSSSKRALRNDVTVCGERQPAAYVTEYFVGDGVTTQFDLAYAPYMSAAARRTLIRELFDEGMIDARVWGTLGGDGCFAPGAGGLMMQGGDGVDGDTLLSWLDPIEMGGTLLLEATGITLGAGSTGILAGFFAGLETQSGCVAGFQVTAQQGSGAANLQPVVEGGAQGASYAINPTNQYALRVRVHCNEMERMLATYRSCDDAGPVNCGGQTNQAGATLQLEIQEFVNGVAGMPVTLYDGLIASLPAVCTVVAASSINLHGTMRGLNLTTLGSAWVTSATAGGSQVTRRIGTTAEAAECHVEGSGRLIFYAGYAPKAGDQIVVTYRSVERAVGHQVNSASQQALAQAGLPAVSAWVGSVTSPAARSSQDCRNAAQALVAAASCTSASWRGSYRGTNASFASDVWPGDALQLAAPSANMNAQVIVRAMKLSYTASVPDFVEYVIDFANDWAEDLAIRTSETVPEDAWLPATPGATPLPSLNALAVSALSGNTVTIETGTTAPQGGGFEIRRRDHAFAPGEDTDLVMRGSQSTMTFARTAASDRYFVRAFDGATPPNYSEFSATVIFNLPMGS